MTEGKIKTKRK